MKEAALLESLVYGFSFGPHQIPPRLRQKANTIMQSIQYSTERYTDREHFAVMTRTRVLKYAQLIRIADHLRRDAEEVALSSDPPTAHDCRIAGAMLGWAFSLVPVRIATQFDY